MQVLREQNSWPTWCCRCLTNNGLTRRRPPEPSVLNLRLETRKEPPHQARRAPSANTVSYANEQEVTVSGGTLQYERTKFVAAP